MIRGPFPLKLLKQQPTYWGERSEAHPHDLICCHSVVAETMSYFLMLKRQLAEWIVGTAVLEYVVTALEIHPLIPYSGLEISTANHPVQIGFEVSA